MKAIFREILVFLLKIGMLSVLTQSLIPLLPGDPVETIIEITGVRTPPDVLRSQLGLDQPYFKQLKFNTLKLLHGDFGKSLYSKKSVLDLISPAALQTAKIATVSMLIAIFLVLFFFPVVTGLKKKQHRYRTILSHLHVGWLSTPTPLLALFFLYLWSLAARITPWLTLPLGAAVFLGVQISLVYLRFIVRLWEDEQPKPLWRAARARGLTIEESNFKYAVSPRLGAFFAWAGYQVGSLLTGMIVVEYVFNLPGMGSLFVEALNKRDYPLLQGVLFYGGVFLFLGQTLGDKLARFWNPEIRRP